MHVMLIPHKHLKEEEEEESSNGSCMQIVMASHKDVGN